MPLKTRRRETSPMKRLALSKLKEKLNSELDMPFELEVVSDSRSHFMLKMMISLNNRKRRENIKALENSIGFSIDVRPMEKSKSEKR